MFARLFLTILLLTSLPLSAATVCDADSPDCTEVGQWQVSVAVGAGVRTNPVMKNDNIPLIVLPQISYTGERFFLQNLDLGYIFFEDDAQQFNVLLTPSYDQVFFRRWDANNFLLSAEAFAEGPVSSDSLSESPVPTLGPSSAARNIPLDTDQLRKRRMAGLAGFEYNRTMGQLDLQLHALHEFTGLYHGQELRFSLAKNYVSGKHHLRISAGGIWQSSEVLDYYYGIEDGEGGVGDYRYRPGSGISGVMRLDWNYQLSKRWGLTFTTAYRALAADIRRSPIVTENKVITAFVGGVYHF